MELVSCKIFALLRPSWLRRPFWLANKGHTRAGLYDRPQAVFSIVRQHNLDILKL